MRTFIAVVSSVALVLVSTLPSGLRAQESARHEVRSAARFESIVERELAKGRSREEAERRPTHSSFYADSFFVPAEALWKHLRDEVHHDVGDGLMFVQHMLAVLRPGGMVVTVMPHGVLFRGGAENEIRTGILDADQIDAGCYVRLTRSRVSAGERCCSLTRIVSAAVVTTSLTKSFAGGIIEA